MYNMDSGNNRIPEEYKYMYNNIYNVDSDFVVGLFCIFAIKRNDYENTCHLFISFHKQSI